LLAIAAIAVLPLAAIAIYNVWASARDRHSELSRSTTETVRALLTAVDNEISASIAALEALSTSASLMAGDLAGFYDVANRALKRRESWENIVLIDPAGQQRINLRRPFGEPLPKSNDGASVTEVVTTGKPLVTDIITAPIALDRRFVVRVPVFKNGSVAYVLTAGNRQDRMRHLLERQGVPSDAVIAILDRNGTVVARSRAHEQYVGKPASATLREFMAGHTERFGITTTLEGNAVYTVFSRSPVTGWAVAMGIPKQSLDTPLRSAYLVLTGFIVISLLLGLGGALLVSYTVIRPMNALQSMARAMRSGQRIEMPSSQITEIAEAMNALATAQTEREALLLNEQETRRSAEAASRGKDEFLAMLGHELRNPLAAIAAASALLQMTSQGNQHHRGAVETIVRQSKHLTRILEDLLDVSRVINGKIALQRSAIDFTALVQHAMEVVGLSVAVSHVVHSNLDSVWIDGDPSRIEQIVVNLLSNARKYTPEGGRISVQLRALEGEAVLRIEDSGVGIAPELLPRIFDLFVQGHRALHRAEGGLGVGLTLARKLAELHDGTVTADSRGGGQGSTFELRLPCISPLVAPMESRSHATINAKSVLLVEDNTDVRDMMSIMLSMAGHTVFEAADGSAAIEAAVKHCPDLAFIDIGLPGIDGYQVAREIRTRLGTTIRLVALTGYGLPQDIAAAHEAGFDHHIIKPISEGALRKVMES